MVAMPLHEEKENLNIQLKKGVLELCVLSLVSEGDRYGYDLVSRISQNISIAEGTIYPLLARLTREGYFTTYLKESPEGPPRKYYAITRRGREARDALLREWESLAAGVAQIILNKSSKEDRK